MTKLPRPRPHKVDPNPWSAAKSLDLPLKAKTAAFQRVLDLLPPDGSPIRPEEFYTRAAAARKPIPRRTAEWHLRKAEEEGLAERTREPGGRGRVLYRRVPAGEWMARFTAEWYAPGLNEADLRELLDVPPLDAKRERVAGRLAGRLITGLWQDDRAQVRALKRALRIKADQGEDAAMRSWNGWLRERNRRIDGRLSDLFGHELLWGEDAVEPPVSPDVALRAVTIALNIVETIRRARPRALLVSKPPRTGGKE
jgi:DNA-binding transcriptional ArsR family regulator